MLQRLTSRLTYANVTATLALFIALGGTSYAALKLPRNSVGSAQIRRNAVGSSEVRNRSLRLTDLSRSTRAALKGQTGGQGPAGPAGPAGAPAVRYFAAVSASGGLLRGNAAGGGHGVNPGEYDVAFAASVSGCAYSATIGTTDGSQAPAGRAVVSDQAGRVGVRTYDAAGAPADLPFHLIVAC